MSNSTLVSGLLMWSFLLLSAIAQVITDEPVTADTGMDRPDTTYEKFLPLATGGDAEIQNLLGYMYFFGEGVMQDYDRAYDWFRNAAENDDPRGQMNLALFHSGMVRGIPRRYLDPGEATRWISRIADSYAREDATGCVKSFTGEIRLDDLTPCFQHTPDHSRDGIDMDAGAKLYAKFCAGCHGFNGIAYYVNSPSFALGERLHKSDFELEKSITSGITAMPSWGDKLNQSQIRSILAFIRSLPAALEQGIAGNLRSSPPFYFRFRPLGETGSEWFGADPVGGP